MKFENKTDFNPNYCYGVINENLSAWREAIGSVEGLGGKRGAAICSGGEVGFFLLTPLVQDELVMVDYSHGSLWYALGKYKAIEKMGAPKAHEEFVTPINTSSAEYSEWYRKVNFPKFDHNTRRYEEPDNLDGMPKKELYELFCAASAQTGIELNKRNSRIPYNWPPNGLARIWEDIPVEEVANFRKNRTKVTFLHADLRALYETGPFDFVYFSNALQYSPEPDRSATPQPRSSVAYTYYDRYDRFPQYDMSKFVKPGGHILYTYQGNRARKDYRYDGHPFPCAKEVDSWEVVASIPPKYGRKYGMAWNYEIAKAPATFEKKEAQAA